ncbi:MAG: hypothetical protein COV10_02245 [Candidatus Vogelbacteria bacterium CG10_big_fil_rev_8_21_14_0_10_51_16]|uniref:Reverse transcriptase domain-containing protein n=1 Tax=Candidatus Vogelbacteria bacterium CG10_big_fil_rev_8_21_14_0_10_51_16 TaxID=1975045 RepID=A0A2H0REQ5_9BACT|nr:MAG: hypothetical protein COV10_02245 [Candidatus Vogelbacteria bacterium CG10_big_fil_rev_8_21_14_0_10_51_16]
MRRQFTISYREIISVENLLGAWQEFLRGKHGKQDVQLFQLHLMDNVLTLHYELRNLTYTHGGYHHFKINDPKPRDIHKASVRDRLLHHAIYRKLYPFFDKLFIADSYSCRLRKGTHRANNRLRVFFNIVSKNNTRICWVLKCDIRKFFASIDHQTLFMVLDDYIKDDRTARLLRKVVSSFSSTSVGTGLPLGNLTSQLVVNIYMNEFELFMKHKLMARHYIRYADDFVVLSHSKSWLESILPIMRSFLVATLSLSLHPNKVSITSLASGVDILGWVHFTDHRVLRTATKRRMWRKLLPAATHETVASYKGLLRHGNSHKLLDELKRIAPVLD